MKKQLLLLILISLSITNVFAQWQKITGLQGEPVWWLHATSTHVYVNTEYGVVESTNGGNSWTKNQDLFFQGFTNVICSYQDTIIVSGIPDNYFSTDDGATWSLISSPGSGDVSEMAYQDGMMYAATYFDGFYFSPNQGFSWGNITQGLPATTSYYSVATDGNYVYLASDDGLFISTNDGFNFTIAPSPIPVATFTKVYANGSYVYAYGNNMIYRSTNHGATWTTFDTGAPAGDVTDFHMKDNYIFACAGNTIARSDTAAAGWSSINNGLTIAEIGFVDSFGNDLLIGTSEGVFRSANNGGSWNNSSQGLDPFDVEAVHFNNNRVFAGASTYGLSYYNWLSGPWVYNGYNGTDFFCFASKSDTVFAGTGDGIYRSVNNGTSYALMNTSNPANISDAFDMIVSDSIIAATTLSSNILISTDYGATWDSRGNGSGLGGQITTCLEYSGGNLVLGTATGGIFLSSDLGMTWTAVGAPATGIYDLITMGNKVIGSSFTSNGCYISNDNGQTWNPSNSPWFSKLVVSGNLLIGTAGYDLSASLDSGATWPYTVNGIPDADIISLYATQNDLIAGTDVEGVWWTPLTLITSDHNLANSSYTEKVAVYPNPTNGPLTFELTDKSMNGSTMVLVIYNTSGQMILKSRLNDRSSSISMNKFSDGLYFYELRGEREILGRGKIVLNKE